MTWKKLDKKTDLFGIAATISLLIIFPFVFSVLPGHDLANPIVTAVFK